eukprot:SAG22_NODE_10444_length_535_cov_1.059633_2_plen_111_part_01
MQATLSPKQEHIADYLTVLGCHHQPVAMLPRWARWARLGVVGKKPAHSPNRTKKAAPGRRPAGMTTRTRTFRLWPIIIFGGCGDAAGAAAAGAAAAGAISTPAGLGPLAYL